MNSNKNVKHYEFNLFELFEYFFNKSIAFLTNNGEKQFIPIVVIFSILDIISHASLKDDPSLNSISSLHVIEIQISLVE